MIQPALGGVQAAQRGLKYKRYPDSSPEKVQRLVDGMLDIDHRLKSLEIAHSEFARESGEASQDILPAIGDVRVLLQSVFRAWAGLESGGTLDAQPDELHRLARDMERQLEMVEARHRPDEEQDEALADLYALVGATRGLLDAVACTEPVIHEINWKQLAAARF